MHDDQELYGRWLATGDEDAFTRLATRHASLVTDVAYRVGGDRGIAEDALQDALLALARDGTPRPGRVGVRAWLARAAISKARNARASGTARARREQSVATRRTERSMDAATEGGPDDVSGVLSQLGGEDAALLSMRFVHQMGYADLAAVLDVGEPTARVRVHRALERARKAAARPDLDERAFGALLATVPAFSVPDEVVEEMTHAAIAAAKGGGVGAALQGAAGPHRAWLLPMLLACLLTVGAIVLVSVLSEPTGDGEGASRSESVAGGAPGLRGRGGEGLPANGAAPGDPAGRPGAPATPGKQAGTRKGAARRPAGPQPPLTAVRVRMEVQHADGVTEELEITSISHRGFQFTGAALQEHPELLRTRPGQSIALETNDERVAIPSVRITVPDPVPPEITVTVPSVDHPNLERLQLEVVDAVTGLPLPTAVLHWGEGQSAHSRQSADSQGRITVRAPPGPDAMPAIWYFSNAEHYVHAPGYEGAGWSFGTIQFIPSVDADVVGAWLATGTQRVALRPIADDPDLEERTLQIVDAQGVPVPDAYVGIAYPTRDFRRPLREGGRPDAGFRVADAHGVVRFPMREVVGLEVRRQRVLVAAWKLSKDGWPGTGPRVMRMPELVRVALTVEDIPALSSGEWWRDPLRARRQPEDGPCLTPGADAAAEAYLKANEASLAIANLDGAHGEISALHSTIVVDVVAGQTQTIYMQIDGGRRSWTVTPTAGVPLKLTRSWKDLPVVER